MQQHQPDNPAKLASRDDDVDVANEYSDLPSNNTFFKTAYLNLVIRVMSNTTNALVLMVLAGI